MISTAFGVMGGRVSWPKPSNAFVPSVNIHTPDKSRGANWVVVRSCRNGVPASVNTVNELSNTSANAGAQRKK